MAYCNSKIISAAVIDMMKGYRGDGVGDDGLWPSVQPMT